jgi:hypothetical protein
VLTDKQARYYEAKALGLGLLAEAENALADAERLEPYGSNMSSAIAHHEHMAAEYARWETYWAALATGATPEEAGLADLLADRPSHSTVSPEAAVTATTNPGA